ncbi:MAG TPA: NADH-quinone oxidoreductase subunit C [Longimicrobiales bacterium]|nr:NADH-quinone oxidoreductase subunit C [Longimicrobiales bacterium]
MADDFRNGLEGLESGPEATEGPEAARGEGADASSHPSVAALRERFGDAVLHHEIQAGDEHVVFIPADRNVEVLTWLRDDQEFDLLRDVTAVDYGGGRPIQVVYELWSIPRRRQLRVKVELPLEGLEVRTVVPLWSTADWLERETYDMFGVQFGGHPDLRRILMPDNYAEGHPLRKDFPLRGRFSRAEQTRRALSFDLADHYAPSELEVLKKGDWARAQDRARAEQTGETVGSADFPADTSESRDPRDVYPDMEEQGG